MAIKKIMFENEVLEVGEINEKYNPTAVKGIEGIRPLWTLWISIYYGLVKILNHF